MPTRNVLSRQLSILTVFRKPGLMLIIPQVSPKFRCMILNISYSRLINSVIWDFYQAADSSRGRICVAVVKWGVTDNICLEILPKQKNTAWVLQGGVLVRSGSGKKNTTAWVTGRLESPSRSSRRPEVWDDGTVRAGRWPPSPCVLRWPFLCERVEREGALRCLFLSVRTPVPSR